MRDVQRGVPQQPVSKRAEKLSSGPGIELHSVWTLNNINAKLR